MSIQEKLTLLDKLYAGKQLAEAETQLRTWIDEACINHDAGTQLTMRNELEGLLRVTGRAEEACEHAELALMLIEELHAVGSMVHGTTLLNAATANRAAGNLRKSLEYYHQAAQVYAGFPDSVDKEYYLATLYNNIGQVYEQLGKYEDAREFLELALEGIEKLAGSESETATTKSNLALILLQLGETTEAQKYINESLAYYDTPASQNDHHRYSAYAAAGQIAYAVEEYDKACRYLEEALRLAKEIYGDTPESEGILENLKMAKEKCAQ